MICRWRKIYYRSESRGKLFSAWRAVLVAVAAALITLVLLLAIDVMDDFRKLFTVG
jgi:hypothetical protein